MMASSTALTVEVQLYSAWLFSDLSPQLDVLDCAVVSQLIVKSTGGLIVKSTGGLIVSSPSIVSETQLSLSIVVCVVGSGGDSMHDGCFGTSTCVSGKHAVGFSVGFRSSFLCNELAETSEVDRIIYC